MSRDHAVELEHVTRTYKRANFEVRALDDVTLSIREQRFVAIMGRAFHQARPCVVSSLNFVPSFL